MSGPVPTALRFKYLLATLTNLRITFTGISQPVQRTAVPPHSLRRTFYMIYLGYGTFVSRQRSAVETLESQLVFCAGARTPAFPSRTFSAHQIVQLP